MADTGLVAVRPDIDTYIKPRKVDLKTRFTKGDKQRNRILLTG